MRHSLRGSARLRLALRTGSIAERSGVPETPRMHQMRKSGGVGRRDRNRGRSGNELVETARRCPSSSEAVVV